MAAHGQGHHFQQVHVQGGRTHLGDVNHIGQKNPLSRLPFANLATFNSSKSDADEEAECLSGTRRDVLDRIHEWVDGPSSASIFWLNGMAGRGKSTVARTIARAYYDKKQLGASFFFSRGVSGPNKSAFITTIAVQLASCCSSLRSAITRAAEQNHNVANETLRDQWDQLIRAPLLSLDPESSSTPSALVLVVDALDECESRHAADILRLLPESKSITTVKLRILITSRPETAIRRGFRAMPEGSHEILALDEVPRYVVDGDITEFLKSRFRGIVRDSEGSLSHGWPGQAAVASLVRKAAGLFIYAATVCRFIQQNDCWSPTVLLELFVSNGQSEVLHTRRPELPSGSPTAELDVVYMTVLDRSMAGIENDEKLARYFRLVVGSLVLLFEPLSITALANLLDEHKDTLYRRLCRLRSVLSVSTDLDQPIHLLHPSFRDFLTSKSRCTDARYQVDLTTTHRLLTEHCLGRLTRDGIGLKKDICNLGHPGADTESLGEEGVTRLIPSEMEYACVYWAHHLNATGTPVVDGGWPHRFLLEHFLHWLEALSVIERFSDGIAPLFALHSPLTASESPNLSEFVQDAKRFIRHGRSMIEGAPLQVYCGPLVFTPENSVIRKHFRNHKPPWLKKLSSTERDWNPCLQILESHDTSTALAFSPDGSILASGTFGGNVELWNPSTGSLDFTLHGHAYIVKALAFSPQFLASASLDGTLELWNPLDRTLHATRVCGTYPVHDVCFSPDGRILAYASDTTIMLMDPMTGALHRSLSGHTNIITGLSFSPDGKLLASGSRDCTVLVWNHATGSMHKRLQYLVEVNDVTFSPVDGTVLATACSDRTVSLWDANRGLFRRHAPQHSRSAVQAVEFSPDGACVAMAGRGDLALWNLKSETLAGLSLSSRNFFGMGAVAFSADGRLVASALSSGLIRLWDPIAAMGVGVPVHLERDSHSGPVNDVAVSPSGRLVASVADDESAKLWDPETGTCLATLVGHGDYVQAVAFSPDEQNLASLSRRTVIIWDMATRSAHRTLPLPLGSRPVCLGVDDGISFSPNGRLIAVHSSRIPAAVWLWDSATGTLLHSHEYPFETYYWAVAFSPDSRFIAAVCSRSLRGGVARYWRAWSAWTGEVILYFATDTHTRDCIEPVRWIYFDLAGTHLRTDHGSVELPRPVNFETTDCPTPAPAAVHVLGRRWVAFNGRRFLRLPLDYMARCSDFRAGILALGHESGRVTILHLNENAIPRS